MKLLFLDIDGVLNTAAYRHEHGPGTLDPYLVTQLMSVCNYTDCRIIVSDNWVRGGLCGLIRVVEAIECELAGNEYPGPNVSTSVSSKIIGSIMDRGDRAAEIHEYVCRIGSDAETWCAVDDLDLDLPEKNFVHINPKHGLLWETSLKVIEKLNGPVHVS